MIVTDYRGRKLTLLARIARKTLGHRYITRNSLALVIQGKSTHTKPSHNCGTQARSGWPSRATKTRVKIGCHVFTGDEAKKLIKWATS